MAYIETPPSAKWTQRAILALRYLFVVGIGILTVGLPEPGMTGVGWALIVTGASALFGVLAHRYRFEWVALSPMVAALLIAGGLIAGSASPVVVVLVTGYGIALLDRLLHLTLVARKLRRMPPKE